MPLFLDRIPFDSWTDQTRTPPQEYWSVVLPVLVTEPGLVAPPTSAVVQHWVLDTALRGEAFAWRRHLLDGGLDPDFNHFPVGVTVTSALGGREQVPIRKAEIWLVSNLPMLQNAPCRLSLQRGIPFRDVPALPDPQFHRPLIGLRVLRRAGLRLELDCARDTVSVWTPDPSIQQP